MKLYHNQRHYSRSRLSVAATLAPEGEDAFGVEVVDLSMGGMFVHSERNIDSGTNCQVSILLGHFKHELPLTAKGVVVRNSSEGIALRFESIELEAVPNLQSLIVEHADDPEKTELEFSSHGGWIFTPS